MSHNTFPCPQCGDDTHGDDFCEGVCNHCWEDNQNALDLHNLNYDRWSKMTDSERNDEIKKSL